VRYATKACLAAALAALTVSVAQSATGAPSSNTLQVSFKMGVILGGSDCPDGTVGVDPARDHCVFQAGAVLVKGLGTVHVTTQHVVILSNASCPRGSVTGELKTARGTLGISGAASGCVNPTFGYGDYAINIVGSGGLSSVSGSGTIANQGAYVVTATLSAPSSLFDIESPVMAGAVTKTVKATSRLGARVRFAVTARDGVDGRVAVSCRPASGTLFRIGRTRVACKATDSSANGVTRSFIVIVKRA
jgi:hypothetical protein